jgi:hypothetical protein
MNKVDRLAERLTVLEDEYRARLINALSRCAAGRWGLFGHNDHLRPDAPVDPEVGELLDLGLEIERIRDRLGLKAFALHTRLMASRGPQSSNAVGEPKQAQAWLDELHPPLSSMTLPDGSRT